MLRVRGQPAAPLSAPPSDKAFFNLNPFILTWRSRNLRNRLVAASGSEIHFVLRFVTGSVNEYLLRDSVDVCAS